MNVIVNDLQLLELIKSAHRAYQFRDVPKFFAALGDALDNFSRVGCELQLGTRANPFEAYRREICGGYSTAYRLAALVKHLYNGAAHAVRLDNLLANADEHHSRIALELMAWYAEHGENCAVFMDLARHLVERDCTPSEANADADE